MSFRLGLELARNFQAAVDSFVPAMLSTVEELTREELNLYVDHAENMYRDIITLRRQCDQIQSAASVQAGLLLQDAEYAAKVVLSLVINAILSHEDLMRRIRVQLHARMHKLRTRMLDSDLEALLSSIDAMQQTATCDQSFASHDMMTQCNIR
ncbi:uncharacterized protein N7482_006603 [Penicillium canariense]|uniref:Uncharacterized protein n=1 Tax=Penicillium canariense TaxID=189055 RepID=A0A9W9HV26_9EURO|nr:uncharacterized protein N7482_006603 [Penicillium canariense]KAJ5159599.1 hypothetical protein N7482_006603 [Penicillium canariense]